MAIFCGNVLSENSETVIFLWLMGVMENETGMCKCPEGREFIL